VRRKIARSAATAAARRVKRWELRIVRLISEGSGY
jgi:hypothetical protein